jgi:DNA-binding transcriptional regulator YiaG
MLREPRKVAGATFVAQLSARACPKCQETYIDGPALERFDLLVAARLLEAGRHEAEVFRFARRALGLRAAELAKLLDVAPETISRWETGERPAGGPLFALLGALVAERLDGGHRTLDMLRAQRRPRALSKEVRLRVRAA